MEVWSAEVSEPFHVKFELDTNILTYLVDETYPSLKKFISILQQSKFVYETSISAFVLYEFIGIRKKEHFLRQAFGKNKSSKGEINFSSLLKYKDSYSTPQLDYHSVSEDIENFIDGEINFLNDEIGILINSQSFHENILAPAKSLYLNSKISKEDCLVIISSVFPDKFRQSGFLCLITNDAGLKQSFTEKISETKVSDCFEKNLLIKPYVEYIADQKHNALGLNLTDNLDDYHIQIGFIKLLDKLLIEKNKSLYLGKTFKNNCSGIVNVICVQTDLNSLASVNNPPFFTIVGKDFDFIINTRIEILEVRNKRGDIVKTPFLTESFEDGKFSFVFPSFEDDHKYKEIENDILNKIRSSGNLVFIHPDSE